MGAEAVAAYGYCSNLLFKNALVRRGANFLFVAKSSAGLVRTPERSDQAPVVEALDDLLGKYGKRPSLKTLY
jgi:hypothetical protein